MHPLTAVFSGHETMRLMDFLLRAPDDGPFIAPRARDQMLFSISRSNGQWSVEDCEGFHRIEKRKRTWPGRSDGGESSEGGGARHPEASASSALTIGYQYRDADNYKCQNLVNICPAPEGEDLILVLTALLADSEGFVPSEIGMTDIQHMMASTPNFDETDHTYHEVVTLASGEIPGGNMTSTGALAPEKTPADEIIRLARAWIEGGRTWNHEAAIDRIGNNT